MKSKIKIIPVLILMIMAITACSQRKQDKTNSDPEKPSYKVYYIAEDGSALASVDYLPEGETFDEILGELLEQLETDTVLDQKRMPGGVTIKGFTKSIDNITVDLSSSYLALDNVNEILLRAAVVRTLSQLPGVASVSITVDEQPLTDLDGSTVGPMSDEMFIDTGGMGINSYAYRTYKLYYPNAEGKALRSENREVFSSTNLLPERVIIEEIIRGPETKKLQAAVSPRVKVNSVRLNNQILQVDLDQTFIQTYSEDVTARAALYSFVNSIFEVTDAEGIQFSVDGQTDVRFRNEIGLDQTFVRDNELIDEEQTEKSESKKKQKTDETQSETAADQEDSGNHSKAKKQEENTSEQDQTVDIGSNGDAIVGLPAAGAEDKE